MMNKTTSGLIKTNTFKGVNCYLIKTKAGYILIDTGYSNQRINIENTLNNAGVQPENLVLILLTHGDFDHSGNCAYLREKYKSKIAMHKDDLGMVEHGDLFYSRESRNIIIRKLVKMMLPLFKINLKKKDQFTPDIYLEEGDDLSEYGFSAKVVHLPGHSKGSIGFHTTEGDLFIGDLLENNVKRGPVKCSLIDNSVEFDASIAKLINLSLNTVYPGHGNPFQMEDFIKNTIYP
ncbi:MAG: MBL fold metallo-hydrolase [Candidatus Heimdallarchaeota archaeon]|nr:MAG: MBL fold metallo-hydrolase [Candidatus Heimdallarchaeota archaeon]